MLLYDVDVEARPIRVEQIAELRAPGLANVHGLDFIGEERLAVANRKADLQIYRLHPFELECRVRSAWFGPVGATRELRGRGIVCGPGSVRFDRGRLYVCCNYQSTLTVHACTINAAGIEVVDEAILAREGYEIIDGVALSADGRFAGLSDHDHHRVTVNRRSAEGLGPGCSLRDPRLKFPHGICFDRTGNVLYAADAGSPNLFAFETPDGWTSDCGEASFVLTAVSEEAFEKSREGVPEWARPLEGGAKGLDLHPAGRVLAATCQNQMLAFFEVA